MEFGKYYDEANAQNGNCKCGGCQIFWIIKYLIYLL